MKAFEQGQQANESVMIEFIKNWDGKTNSELGQLLHDKLAELPTQMLSTTTSVEQLAKQIYPDAPLMSSIYAMRKGFIEGYNKRNSEGVYNERDVVKICIKMIELGGRYHTNQDVQEINNVINEYNS